MPDDSVQGQALMELMSAVGYATVFLLAVISPLSISLLSRPKWSTQTRLLVSIVVTAFLAVLGFFFDAKLTWPLPPQFWLIMIAMFGTQQLSFLVFKKQLKAVETFSTPIADIKNSLMGYLAKLPLTMNMSTDAQKWFVRSYLATEPVSPSNEGLRDFVYANYDNYLRLSPVALRTQVTNVMNATGTIFDPLTANSAPPLFDTVPPQNRERLPVGLTMPTIIPAAKDPIGSSTSDAPHDQPKQDAPT